MEKEDNEVFLEAKKALDGASYEALAVSTQVVDGVMYAFLCNAQAISPGSEPCLALLYAAKLITGAIEVQKITKRVEA